MPKARNKTPVVTPAGMRLLTVAQMEAAHPGVERRLRGWIFRADAGHPDFEWLRPCVVRIGRSVLLDDRRFSVSLSRRAALPPAPSRRT